MFYYTVGGEKYHYRPDCGKGKKYMAVSLDGLPKKASKECKHCKNVSDKKWASIRGCNGRKVKKVQKQHDLDAEAGIRQPRRTQAMSPQEYRLRRNQQSNDYYHAHKHEAWYQVGRHIQHTKDGAKRRELPMALSNSTIREFLILPCTYCSSVVTEKNIDPSFNGIDRVINDDGYYDDNVVSCCKECNRMKWTHTLKDFVQICTNVAINFDRIDRPSTFDFQPIREKFSQTFSEYKRSAQGKGRQFTLSQEEFHAMAQSDCYYCSRHPSPIVETNHLTGPTGIDRVNPKIGYVPENCVPCCLRCNYAKHTMEEQKFIDKCSSVAQNWSWLLDMSDAHEQQLRDIVVDFNAQNMKQGEEEEDEEQ